VNCGHFSQPLTTPHGALLLIFATLVGCAHSNTAPAPKDPVEKAIVNGFEISSYDGSGLVNSFQATWKSNPYSVSLVPKPRVNSMHETLERILIMVRHDLPEKQPFTFVANSWPQGCAVFGVTRGDDVSSFEQGQFLIRAQNRSVIVEMFARNDAVSEASLRQFFTDVKVTATDFQFPEDAGSGSRLESPLYPDPSELP
jgi:hypothetical protein